MSDAVNTVQNRYTRHAYSGALEPAASAEAAAVAAARAVLAALCTDAEGQSRCRLFGGHRRFARQRRKERGIAIGEKAAALLRLPTAPTMRPTSRTRIAR